MKNLVLGLTLFIVSQLSAQITFRGCEAAVLGAQDFTLMQTGTTNDGGTIRNTFESTPADFAQSCPSGVCELRIVWNISNSRWEIQLDNDGPLGTPDYTTAALYYNMSASEPNPPSLLLGTWVDNLGGSCGGDGSFTTLTGDVQDVVLGVNDVEVLNKEILMFPNPAKDVLSIESSLHSISKVAIFSLLGQEVASASSNFDKINISNLSSKIYLVKIETIEGAILIKKLMVN